MPRRTTPARWVEQFGFSREKLDEAKRLWERFEVPGSEIAAFLGLAKRSDLYRLAQAEGWRRRATGMGRARLSFTYTTEEAAEAERLWYAGGTLDELCALLHLAARRQVYLVRDREGWGPREVASYSTEAKQRRSGAHPGWAESVALAEHRAARPEVARGPVRPLTARAARAIPMARSALTQECPGCGFRAAPDPEHGALVGDVLWHRGCLPKGTPFVAPRPLSARARAIVEAAA